jgi:hypothetical protein
VSATRLSTALSTSDAAEELSPINVLYTFRDIVGSDLLLQIHLGKLARTSSSLLAFHLLLHSTLSLGNMRLQGYAPQVHPIPVVSVLSICVLHVLVFFLSRYPLYLYAWHQSRLR